MRVRTQLLEEKGFIKYKNEINKQKLPHRGKLTGQTTFDDKLAQNCKQKEIIKGANEEGNEITQVG